LESVTVHAFPIEFMIFGTGIFRTGFDI